MVRSGGNLEFNACAISLASCTGTHTYTYKIATTFSFCFTCLVTFPLLLDVRLHLSQSTFCDLWSKCFAGWIPFLPPNGPNQHSVKVQQTTRT